MSFVSVFCSMALAFGVSAAFAQNETSPQQSEALHNELRQLRSNVEAAINQGNMDGLLANLEDDVIFTTMNNDSTTGKEGLRDYFVKWVQSPSSPVEKIQTIIKPDALSVFLDPEKKLALSAGVSEDTYFLKDKSTLNLQARWTALLSKRSGSWKLAALHYSSNIFDNPIQKKIKQLWIVISIAACAAGLVVGFLLGRRRKV